MGGQASLDHVTEDVQSVRLCIALLLLLHACHGCYVLPCNGCELDIQSLQYICSYRVTFAQAYVCAYQWTHVCACLRTSMDICASICPLMYLCNVVVHIKSIL